MSRGVTPIAPDFVGADEWGIRPRPNADVAMAVAELQATVRQTRLAQTQVLRKRHYQFKSGRPHLYAVLAQSAERSLRKRKVPGSTPRRWLV